MVLLTMWQFHHEREMVTWSSLTPRENSAIKIYNGKQFLRGPQPHKNVQVKPRPLKSSSFDLGFKRWPTFYDTPALTHRNSTTPNEYPTSAQSQALVRANNRLKNQRFETLWSLLLAHMKQNNIKELWCFEFKNVPMENTLQIQILIQV